MNKRIHALLSLSIVLFYCLPSYAADYYWIGGSGNWSDISHWATSSGGAVTYAVVPSPNDRVIFDENSFDGPNQQVSVLVDNIFCMDMDWSAVTNNPGFVIPRNTDLHLHGSLQLSPDMTWDHSGDLLFRTSSTEQSITTANHLLAHAAYFSGPGGSWNLQDAFTTDSLIYLEEGSLDLGNSQVRTRYLDASEATTNFTLNWNNAYVTLTGTTFLSNDFQLENYAPAKFRADRNTFSSGSATLELAQANAEIWANGDGTLRLPKVVFSASEGRAYVGARDFFGFETVANTINTPGFSFASNALIRLEGTIDTLALSAGKSYSLDAGSTYTIQDIQADGSCVAPITLSSTDGNVGANLIGNGGDISVNYLNLRGIQASGPATFTNNEGADLGGNSGWTFNTTPAMDLYWVGGNGDWNEAANWSFSSGGAGGACLPNGNTNVFFDANSFDAANQLVNVNVDQISCRSMDWSGVLNNPTFQTLNSTTLSIFGSLNLEQDMTWNHTGLSQFLSNQTGQSISMSGQSLKGNVEFDGAGGEWILQDSFVIFDNINLNNGHLNSNNQYIETSRFYSNTENPRRLSLGSSTLSFRQGQENVFQALTNNLVVDAGTSHIITNDGNAYLNFNQPNVVMLHHFTARGFLNVYSPPGNQSELSFQKLRTLGTAFFTRFRADTLILTPNRRYELQQADTLSIGHIIASGACSDYISLNAGYPFQTAYLSSENNQSLDRIIIENIHIAGPGVWTANQSTNLGNTDGWVFPENNERTLFWIGDNGDWADPNHWSLSSGGPGGECIPTPNDNVIFDQNSFTTPNATVFSSREDIFFKDMDWRTSTNNPILQVPNTNCYGSLYLSADMVDATFGYLRLLGNGDHDFAPMDFRWGQTEFRSSGIYRFLSDFKPGTDSRLIIRKAEIFTNGFDWSIGELLIENPESVTHHIYHFADSRIEISGSPFNQPSLNVNFEVNATITSNTAEFEISGPDLSAEINGIFPINKLFFSATNGTSSLRTAFNNSDIGRFGNIIFNSSANIDGPVATDSLILAAGKVFQFSNNFSMQINNYLQALGNNCLPISLRSRAPGFQATIEMPVTAVVLADFIQMQDHNATGGADFFAGDFSSDVANNTGWTFGTPSPNTQNGFLGADQYFCSDATAYTLNASFNTAGEVYRWQDGSDQATFAAPGPGTYFAEVTFPAAANCVIRDTISLLAVPDFAISLPTADTSLCDSETLLLDVSSSEPGTQYLWQDSSRNATFTVDSAGLYRVQSSFENCTVSDSMIVTYRERPEVDLGGDVLLCADEDITLRGNTLADDYLWSDGSNGSELFVDRAGTYWLEASNGRCQDRDSIVVSFADDLGEFLGADRALCPDTNLVLRGDLANASYLWQDGSSLDSLLVNQPGTYSVTARIGNCEAQDTVMVDELPLASFNLGPDREFCGGTTAILNGNSTQNGASYLWEDGSSDPVRNISTSGTYILTSTLNGCAFRDTANLVFTPIPTVDLGMNTNLCDGDSLVLDAGNTGATYRWNNGSTNRTLTARVAGSYSVEVNLNNCLGRDSIELSFSPVPVFDLGMDQTSCTGDSIQLDGTSTVAGTSYQWADDADNTNPVRIIRSSGTYTLRARAGECTFEDQVNINLSNLSQLDLGGDQTLCEGASTTLTPNINVDNFLWQDGSSNPNLTVSSAGTYWLEVSQGDCSARDSVVISVNSLPQLDLGPDQTLCSGETAVLDAGPDADFYFWGNGSTNQTLSVNTTGRYSVEVEQNGCTTTDEVQVNFEQAFPLNLGPDIEQCSDLSLSLRVPSGLSGSWIWNDGSTGATLPITESGTYWLELNSVCTVRDSIEISLIECLRFQYYAPNSFSPNEDGINDEFKVFFPEGLPISDFSLQIYDRWGGLLFTTQDPNTAWDGKKRGVLLPTGAYFWRMQLTYEDDFRTRTINEGGDIMILR